MAKGLHPVVKLAKKTVEGYIRKGKTPKLRKLTPEMKERAGVFVSLHKHGQLRGCIGTFEPTEDNVAEEIIANAVSSSTGDPRFPPVTESELDDLEYSVDILTRPEPVADINQLDHEKYSVIVESGRKKGLLLPALPERNMLSSDMVIKKYTSPLLSRVVKVATF